MLRLVRIMNERILVWGLGNEFKKNKIFIEEQYEVIGYVDSKIQKTQIIDGKYFYSVEDIKKSNFNMLNEMERFNKNPNM